VISLGGGLFGDISPSGVVTNGDIQAYWTSIGIPTANQPKVIVIPISGATNSPVIGQGDTIENTIDVSIIGACCPTASLTIILYLTVNSLSEFVNVITRAYKPVTIDKFLYTPSVISISWGAAEVFYSSAELRSINNLLKTVSEAGINVCASTGDNGSSDGVSGGQNYVDFPGSSPYVTACGGTTLTCPTLNYSDPSTVEIAWSSGGGGKSGVWPKPVWQNQLAGAIGAFRCIPDISLNADPSTGITFLIGGKKSIIGGTSIVSPAVAAYYACLNTGRYLNPSLYKANISNPLAFNDITVGSNGAYSANAGYDFCTGIGSINGDKLASQLLTPTPPTTVPVTGIALDTATVTLYVGGQKTIAATIVPINATNKLITWATDNNFVSVSPITSKCVSTFTATCAYAGSSLCECLANAKALPDSSALVTGNSAGVANVTATTSDGGFVARAVFTITVPPVNVPVTGVTINMSIVKLVIGEQMQLIATVAPPNATNPQVSWSSSGGEVTVSETGLITAVAVGLITITVRTLDGGFQDTTIVRVMSILPIIPVSGLRLDVSQATLMIGETKTLTAIIEPYNATNKDVTWTSSSDDIATVSSSGEVTAIDLGNAVITVVSADGGFSASATIIVYTHLVSIAFNTPYVVMRVGDTVQTTLIFDPPHDSFLPVTYTSHSKRIATIDEKGLITGIGQGITTIKATVATQSAVLYAYVFPYSYY
jgi:hypothetical protein